mmetsp:Transcript_9188/g.27369  ORF Transcript_9188/g.27369 Transcript_9188/m.27369 type:complete len:2459 (-) Transcript_9188:742-8118(-)
MDHLVQELGASATILGRKAVLQVRESVLPRLERELRDNIVPKLEQTGEEWKERWHEHRQNSQQKRRRRRRPRPPSNTDIVYLTDRFLVSSKPAIDNSNGRIPTFLDTGRDESARDKTKEVETENGKQSVQAKQNHQRGNLLKLGSGGIDTHEASAYDGENHIEQEAGANPGQSPSASSIPEEVDEEAAFAHNGECQKVGTMPENPQDGGAETIIAHPPSVGEENSERAGDEGVKRTDESDQVEDEFFSASQSSLPIVASISTYFSNTDEKTVSGDEKSHNVTPMNHQQVEEEEPPTPLTKNVTRTSHLLADLTKAGSNGLMTAPSMTLLPPSSTSKEMNSALPGIVSPGDKSSSKEINRSDAASDDDTFHSTREEDESQTQQSSSSTRPNPSSSPPSTATALSIINSPGTMVTYLDKVHGRHNYLAVSLAKEKPDDRTMLLFRRQIVPMGIDGSGGNPSSRWSPCCVERSETPSIPHVLKVCYLIHAFLKLDPNNVVLTYCDNGKTRTAIVAACYLKFSNMVGRTEDGFRYFLRTLRRQRKLLLEREKERRKQMGPILTAAMDAILEDYDDGERVDVESAEEMKNSIAVLDRLIQQIPPSLKLFFEQFDRVLQMGGFLNRKPLLLRAITLQGIPVEEQPCLDIWDSSQRHIYSSHYPVSKGTAAVDNSNNSKPVSQWVDEEGFYRINVVLDGEFLVLCRFGGESAHLPNEQNIHDPSKILFRYTNTTGFMCGGCPYELPPQKVDLMRRYADHLNDEDFLVTLILEADWERIEDSESIGDNALPEATRERLKSSSEVCGKRIWRSHEEEARDEGWKVIFENHPARPITGDINSFRNFCGNSLDVKSCPDHLIVLCLQLANYDFHRTLALLCDSPVFSWWREDEHLNRVRSASDIDVQDEKGQERCDRYVEKENSNASDGSKKPFEEIEKEATQNVLDILDSIDVTSNLNSTDQRYLQTFKDDQCLSSSSSRKEEGTISDYQQSLSNLCVKETGYLVPSVIYPRRGDVSRSFHIHGKLQAPEQKNDSDSMLPLLSGLNASLSKPRMPYFSDDKPKRLPEPSAHVTDKNRFNPLLDHVVPTYDLKLEAAKEIHSQLRHTGVTLDMLVELERVSKQWTGAPASSEEWDTDDDEETEAAKTEHPQETRGDSTMNREERERKEKEWKDAQKTEAEEKLKESIENKTSREQEKAARQDAERKRIAEEAGTRENSEELPLKDDPEYAKYFKMLRMGLAREQIVHAMQRDEKDPKILDLDPTKSLESQIPDTDQSGDDNVSLKDHPEYSKYFKMIKMGLPREQVLHALKRDEKDPRILDLDPNKSLESQLFNTNDSEDAEPPLKDDPEYTKYFKMLKMGMPKEQVLHALQRDEKDPKILDLDPNKSLKSQQSQSSEGDDGPALKDDPEFVKYFKMEKMGLPKDAIRNALVRDGKDPAIIDLDPSMSVEYQLKKSKSASASDKAVTKKKKKKVRRKKIYWNPIDPSKLKKDSLWNMVRDHVLMGNLEYDQKEFEELFTESAEPGAQKKKAGPAKKAAKKAVQAIDSKRSMNGGIVLSRIKTDRTKIAEYVDRMEYTKFDATQLKNLKEYLATADERRALAAYMSKGAKSEETKTELYNDLSETEKYMVTLMEVSDAEAKLHTMEFRNGFKNRFIEMTASVRTLNTACDQLRTSEKFRKLMAMILTVVNEINTGGGGNRAVGFTLDALLKLNEAKAFDKKTSVLHYVVKLVKKNDESLLAFESDLSYVIPAESVLLDTVVGDLKVIRDELADVIRISAKQAEELEKLGKLPKPTLSDIMEQKSMVQQVGGIPQFNKITHLTGRTSMERFSMNAKVACEQAIESVDNVKAKYLMVLGYFGEDESMSSGDFFGILRRFMTEWKKVIDQVEKIERLQAKERKREARRAAKAKKAREKKGSDKKVKGSALKKAQNEEGRELPVKPTIGGIAALVADAALKKAKKEPPAGGIAALAAQAALKKSKQASPEGGIAALAAQAALKKSNQAKDPVPSGGVAALAAQAALKKSKQTNEALPSGGIATLAANAALKKARRAEELNFSNHAIAPDAASRDNKEGKEAVALKKSKEGKETPSSDGIAALAAAAALKKTEGSAETDDDARVSPKLEITAEPSQDGSKASLQAFFQNRTPQEIRNEILRQNHDDSSVAVMAEDLAKEPMDSSDANNWNEDGKGISDYMGWANRAIKTSDTESVRGFQASTNIVEHFEYDDESTIATNFDDDASISTAMTNPRNFSEEGSSYYKAEPYNDYSGVADDPYNPMAANSIQDPYDNAVINMPLNFSQEQALDAGLSFGGEEGFDGPGEYGSNEMMMTNTGYDNTGLGGFGNDLGLGGFGMTSPTLKRKFQNDFSSPQMPPASAAAAGNDLNRPWGGTPNKKLSSKDDYLDRPWGGQSNKRASMSGDELSRPRGADNSKSTTSGGKEDLVFRGWGESSTRTQEPEQPKAKKWFWQSGG